MANNGVSRGGVQKLSLWNSFHISTKKFCLSFTLLRVFYWIKEDEGSESWMCFCTFIIQSTCFPLPHKAQNYSFWWEIFSLSKFGNLEFFTYITIIISLFPQTVHNAFPVAPLGSCNMNKVSNTHWVLISIDSKTHRPSSPHIWISTTKYIHRVSYFSYQGIQFCL